MSEIVFLPEEYATVTTKAGEPYRLLPFGALVKGGKKRTITPEYAARFKLPHFKPPIKLGSHEDTTPAGGQIVGLEVREDGLYAIPEFTEKGQKSLTDGDYRYHSPEIVWEGGALEDPNTGQMIEGPLIVGDALLHTPHLGEAAALYSVEEIQQEVSMTENIEVPKSLWDRFTAWLDKRTAEPEEQPATPPAVETEQFTALQTERDQYKAQLDALEAEKAHSARVEQFSAALKETQVGEGADVLAGMTDEQAGWVLTQFKALSAKVDTAALYSEKGSNGAGAADSMTALTAAIQAKMDEKKVEYIAAFDLVRAEQPGLIAAAYPVKGGK